ncbi:MAG: hypothetical protein M1825_002634 [Sarcosagium campestre]|nr:MAG: hypothetical protein M1825_002634 [Sarcosagium campestre]
MLDTFEILTTSGVVLWSKTYAPVSPSVINSLITNIFIEERAGPRAALVDVSATSNPPYKKDKYTLKWTTAKDLGLIFVAVYQSLLHLSWIDKLLDNIRIIFIDLYGDQLKKPNTSIVECQFDGYFDQQIKQLESTQTGPVSSGAPPLLVTEDAASASDVDSADDEPPPLPGIVRAQSTDPAGNARVEGARAAVVSETSRSGSPTVSHLLAAPKNGPGGRSSRRARKAAQHSAHASSGEDSEARKVTNKKQAPKKGRKWDADGMMDSVDPEEPGLDYSAKANGTAASGANNDEIAAAAQETVPAEVWGKKTNRGEFILRDLNDEVDSILSSAEAKKRDGGAPSGIVGSSLGAIGGLFRNVVGGKTLTKEDLAKPIKGMEEHLLKKNVAQEAAATLCASVEKSLIGVKTGSFQTIDHTIRTAMETSLRRTLTPTSSLDLLRTISSVTTGTTPRPYVISIVGVNGVGKSTSLSKIAYFLLQNQHSVLLAACDTFRSGAVEQLRVHARNLSALASREPGPAHVELFERGYGKDAAAIARDAVAHAAANGFSIVLIDTAGRRHNDARLMSGLEKFARMARPDKILMVGEALVGSDSVQQARNFNAAFGAGRSLDGFIISKCDTVGEMVGALVSMVFATGIPVLFLGTGQHYSDLRTLNVAWAVGLLMT